MAEVLCAVSLSVVAGVTDLWKPGTLRTPEFEQLVALFFWLMVLGLYGAAKVIVHLVKDKDQSALEAMRAEIQERETVNSSITEQRDDAVRTLSVIREIVDRKLKRLADFNAKPSPHSQEKFLKALAPEVQVQMVMQAIHAFYKQRVKPDASIRLHLYCRNPKDPTALVRLYDVGLAPESKKAKKRKSRIKDYMRLDDPNGTQSVIAECYHGRANEAKIIPDCEAAERDGHFHYFHADQRKYLRSMIAFKHAFDQGGQDDAFIISLDTSQTNFFDEASSAQYRDFLVEMVKRIEYELLGMEIHRKLLPPKPVSPSPL